MKKILCCFLFFMVSFASHAELAPKFKLEKLIREAKGLFNQHQYKQTKIVLEEIFNLGIKVPAGAHYMYAETFYKNGQYIKARSLFENYVNSAGKKGRFFRPSMKRIAQIEAMPWKTRYSVYRTPVKVYSEADAAAYHGDLDRLRTLQKRNEETLYGYYTVKTLLKFHPYNGLQFLLKQKIDVQKYINILIATGNLKAVKLFVANGYQIKSKEWNARDLLKTFEQAYLAAKRSEKNKLVQQYQQYIDYITQHGFVFTSTSSVLGMDVAVAKYLLPSFIHSMDLQTKVYWLGTGLPALVMKKKFNLSKDEVLALSKSLLGNGDILYGEYHKWYSYGSIFYWLFEKVSEIRVDESIGKQQMTILTSMVKQYCSLVPPLKQRTTLQSHINNSSCALARVTTKYSSKNDRGHRFVDKRYNKLLEIFLYACRPIPKHVTCKDTYGVSDYFDFGNPVGNRVATRLLMGFGAEFDEDSFDYKNIKFKAKRKRDRFNPYHDEAVEVLKIKDNAANLRRQTHAKLVAIDKANGVPINSPLGDKEELTPINDDDIFDDD